MRLFEVFQPKKTVAILSGRFQPPHKGHARGYRWLTDKFDDVYIATTSLISPEKSPFSFSEKQYLFSILGIPKDKVVEVKNTYAAIEIVGKYDPANITLIFAVSEKDMNDNPRFVFTPKKDGSTRYLQKYASMTTSADNHGYILTLPTFGFEINDSIMTGATEIRNSFALANRNTQERMIVDLYGEYDPAIHQLFRNRLDLQYIES